MSFEKALVPNFDVNEELEPVVRVVARLHSKMIGLLMDGTREEVRKTAIERDAIIKLTGAEKLAEYLLPYSTLTDELHAEGKKGYPQSPDKAEWYRWFAEYAVRQYLDKV